MENKVVGILDKVEGMIGPATAMISFSKPVTDAYLSGGVKGVSTRLQDNFATWHPPTLEGMINLLEGELGSHIVNTFIGGGIQYIGGVVDTPAISRIGRAIKSAGEGGIVGSTAKMLVFPTLYNPGNGAVPKAAAPTNAATDNPQAKSRDASGSGTFAFQ